MSERGDAWEPPSAPDYGGFAADGLAGDFGPFDALEPPPKGSAAREAWERKNSIVFHAWQEFSDRLDEHRIDHFNRTGRELSERQIADHRHRFAQILRRAYGIAVADSKWIDEHNAWRDRR